MKPQHFVPFNFDHAKAGAPYGTETGAPVEILKWDMQRATSPILALVGDRQETALYGRDGLSSGFSKLVMLPLAMVEGKPVFVGDELRYKIDNCIVITHPQQREFADMYWPKPVKEYPKTRMKFKEFLTVADLQELKTSSLEERERFHMRAMTIANSAIRSAIDDGDIVTREAAYEAIKLSLAWASGFCFAPGKESILRATEGGMQGWINTASGR